MASDYSLAKSTTQSPERKLRAFLLLQSGHDHPADPEVAPEAAIEPFRIVTADGSHYDIRHPENLAITGNGRIVAVAMTDYVATLDLLLVKSVEQPIPHKRNGARPSRR